MSGSVVIVNELTNMRGTMANTHLLFVGLVGAFVLAGCGSGSASGSSTSGGSSSSSESKITTVQQAIDKAVAAGQMPALDTSDSVAGPDADGNGIRDDVDAYINGLPYNGPQKAALQQIASSFRVKVTTSYNSKSEAVSAQYKSARAMNCVYSKFSGQDANKLMRNIQKYTYNTESRFKAYMNFSHLLSGSALDIPKGNTCD